MIAQFSDSSADDPTVILLITVLLCPAGGLVMWITGFLRNDWLFMGLGGLSVLAGAFYIAVLIGAIVALLVQLVRLPLTLLRWWHQRDVKKPERSEADKRRESLMMDFVFCGSPLVLVGAQAAAWYFRFG